MLRAIFSDIDGTLVHYAAKLKEQGYEQMPPTSLNSSAYLEPRIVQWRNIATGKIRDTVSVPSATLGGGFISTRTLELVDQLRRKFGVKFCVLTGARTSTFIRRCESGSLPAFDFGVCEGGGKVFSPTFDRGVDVEWISRFEHVIGDGYKQQNQQQQSKKMLKPEERTGALWDLYRLLKTQPMETLGVKQVKLDAVSYDSAFMVDVRSRGAENADATLGMSKQSEAEKRLKKLVQDKFADQLTVVVNLGKGHVTAKGCTKMEVVEYLCKEKFGLPDKSVTAAMFDDENDLDFAQLCTIGFAVGVAHPAVEAFLKEKQAATPGRFQKCPAGGFLGTEYALEQLLQWCYAASLTRSKI